MGLVAKLNTRGRPERAVWRARRAKPLALIAVFLLLETYGGAPTFAVPSDPALAITKTDGLTQVDRGQTVPYTVTVTNTATVPVADAANVVITDTIPSNSTFVSCAIAAPFTGTCTDDGLGVVTATLNEAILPSSSVQVTVTVQIDAAATGTVTNNVEVAYEDLNGNPFPTETASDVDLVNEPPTAFDDAGSTAENTPVTMTVLTNDTDPENDPLTITGTTNGTTGTVVFTTSTVTYTPNTGFIGTDTFTYTIADGHGGTDTASVTVIVNELSNLSINQDDSPDTVLAGNQVTYTIVVENTGPSTADNVWVNELLPPEFSVATVTSSQGSCSALPCNLGSLSIGATATVTLAVQVSSATAPGGYSVTATAVSDEGPMVLDPETTQVAAEADLSVLKTDSPDPVTTGNNLTYTIVVANSGPSDNAGLQLTDAIPSGTVYFSSSADCPYSLLLNSVTCTNAGLPNGTSVTYTLTVNVLSSFQGPTITNTASITSNSTTDPASGNNSSTTTTLVQQQTELTLSKTDAVASVIAGDGVVYTYTIAVANTGTSDAFAVSISDSFPTGVVRGSLPAPCIDGLGDDFTCSLASIAAGTTQTVTVDYTVPSSTPAGNQTNTVTLASVHPGDAPAGNIASDTTAVLVDTEVVLTKTDGVTNVVAGDGVAYAYTMTVANSGSSDALNVLISDTFPAGFIRGALPPGCDDGAGDNFTCTFPTLVAGVTQTVVIPYTVPSTTGAGPQINTVVLSTTHPGDTSAGNSANDTTNVAEVVEIVLSKTDGQTQVTAGDGVTFTYTIGITNSGPSDAYSVTIFDAFPAGFARTSLPPGCTDAGGGNFTCAFPIISANSTVTITIDYTVPAATGAGFQTNTVNTTSTHPGDIAAGNSASDTTEVVHDTEIVLTKTDGQTTVTAGDGVTYTYTLTVANSGPSDALNVIIADTFPTGFTRGALPAGCTNGAGDNFTCTFASIAAGATVTVNVTYTVPSSTPVGDQANTVAVASTHPGDTAADNSATDITTVVHDTEIVLTKTDGQTTVTAGDGVTYTYTLTVANSGPSDALNVIIADTFPTGFTRGALPAGCTDGAGDNFTCTFASIAAGATVTVNVTYIVPSGTPAGLQVNSWELFSIHAGDTLAGNSASDTTTVVEATEIALQKTDGVTSVVAGDGVTHFYTITVTNAGPSDAVNVLIFDTFPSGFTRGALPPGCDDGIGDDFTCTFPVLVAGIPQTVVIPYTVLSSTAVGPQTNTIGLSTTHPGDTAFGNSASDTTTVLAQADLSVVKFDSPDPVNPTDDITYTILVTNNGPSDALSFSLTDDLPIGTTFVTATVSECAESGGTVTCSSPGLVSGASVSWTLVVNVNAGVADGTIIPNTAEIATASTTDPDGSNNSASATTLVTAPVLTLSKTAVPPGGSDISPGEDIAYTITYSNTGSGTATNFVVTDTVSALLGGVTPSQGGVFDPNTGVITWMVGDVGPGVTGTVTFTATAGATTSPVNITNRAFGTATELAGPIQSNQTTHRLQPPDVAIIKSADRAELSELRAFEVFTYRLTVRNRGAGNALNVVVTDVPPPYLNYVAGTTVVAGVPVADVGGTSPLFGAGINLGAIAPGATRVIEFQMKVDVSAPAGRLLENWGYVTWNLGTQTSGDFYRLLVFTPRFGPLLQQTILVEGPTGSTIFVTIFNDVLGRAIPLLPNTGVEMLLFLIFALSAVGFGQALSSKVGANLTPNNRWDE